MFVGRKMAKGKPWDINEYGLLRDLVEEGKGIEEISGIMVKAKSFDQEEDV